MQRFSYRDGRHKAGHDVEDGEPTPEEQKTAQDFS
jgi:hypothetical protein